MGYKSGAEAPEQGSFPRSMIPATNAYVQQIEAGLAGLPTPTTNYMQAWFQNTMDKELGKSMEGLRRGAYNSGMETGELGPMMSQMIGNYASQKSTMPAKLKMGQYEASMQGAGQLANQRAARAGGGAGGGGGGFPLGSILSALGQAGAGYFSKPPPTGQVYQPIPAGEVGVDAVGGASGAGGVAEGVSAGSGAGVTSATAAEAAGGTAAGSTAAGAGTTTAATAEGGSFLTWLSSLFCWVAREIYGEDNPEWVQFYLWKEYIAPQWFRYLYNKYGENFSLWIHNKPIIKSIIKRFMDSRIKSMQTESLGEVYG